MNPRVNNRAGDGGAGHPLSPRELDVAAMVADGESNAEIAQALGLSIRTVQAHVASAMAKTHSRNRTELAVLLIRAGVVP